MSDPLKNHITLGAFAANEPWPDLASHYALEQRLCVPLPIMSWFTTLDTGWLRRQAGDAASTGHDIQLCIEPVYAKGRAPIPFDDIINGRWDTQLDALFTAMATFPHNIVIRFAHEMNGNWYPWSVTSAVYNTQSLDTWLSAWRYIVSRQRAIGGNVRWMWCVNNSDRSTVPVESYWPGADYVDVMGIDVYNGYSTWTTAKKLIKPMYDRITKLDPNAPIWLAEIGCREVLEGETYSKSGWFEELLNLSDFPRIEAVIFFDMLKDADHDWRITGDAVRTQLTTLMQGAQRIVR